MRDLKTRIERRISNHGRGWVFTRKDLRDISASGPIGVTLARLVKSGLIRRIGRGLYEFPKKSERLEVVLPPDLDQAAQAIARKHRWTIAPDGAMAANLLGLSTQVPAKVTYLSDGPTRRLAVGGQTITFRNTNPKDLRMENYSSRLLAQAMRHLGKPNVDQRVIEQLRRRLPKEDKVRFLQDARYSTDWIFEAAHRIAEA